MNIFRAWDFIFRFHFCSLGNLTHNEVNTSTYTSTYAPSESGNTTYNNVSNLSNSGNTTGGNTFIGTGSGNPLVDQISKGADSVLGSGNTVYYVIGAGIVGLLLFFILRRK
jgi:hypothetical protein